MKVELNDHTFTALEQIIKSSKRTDSDYVRFTVEPTDLFREVWEDPRAQRGPLDKFCLEKAYGDTYFLIAGSDWSNSSQTFWHTKMIVQLTEGDLIGLLEVPDGD